MSISATVAQSNSLGGVSFPESRTLSGDAQVVQNLSVPAAQDGNLTTRTSDSIGTITMDQSDHTITTGDRIDLYWSGGQRRGVTAGIVTATSVPFTGGAGDVLPVATTDIKVALPVEMGVFVDGDNVVLLMAYAAKLGQVVFIDTDLSEVDITTWDLGAGVTKMWHSADGDDSPFLAVNIGRIYVSHGDAAAADMRIGIVYDNVPG